ncbi:hypothetical protein [Flavobacterium ovatum]|uniref:hypothetical protein n=1 Tax=Flavobacterium ovatum TaxID=1928857 RepID=UPI00344BC73D
MEIELQTGRKVQIEAFNMSKTYGGLLVGKPFEAMNDSIIGLVSYSKDWGNRKALLNKEDMYASKNVLKPIIYSVWLTSDVVPQESKINDSSTIVLLWFGEDPKGKSINDIIKQEIFNFDWDEHAENIQF